MLHNEEKKLNFSMLSFSHTLLYIHSDSLIVINVNVILIGTVQNMNFWDNNFIYPPRPL